MWMFKLNLRLVEFRSLAAKDYAAKMKAIETWKKKDKALIKIEKAKENPYQPRIDKLEKKTYTIKDKTGISGGFVVRERCVKRYIGEKKVEISAGAFRHLCGQPVIKTTKPVKIPVLYDCSVSRRPNGKWVLNIPCDAKLIRCQPNEPTKICGIDPGLKTMYTVFDETDHTCWEMGVADERERLYPIFMRAKKAVDKSSDAAKRGCVKEAVNRSRQAKKLFQKVRNKVNALHDVIKHRLVTQYGLVVLGDIDVKDITSKKRNLGRISKIVARIWSICRLRESLLHRARGTGCNVILQSEAWTSKNCSECDTIKPVLPITTRIFRCDHCDYVSGRDVNGARNILRAALGLWEQPKLF